VAAALAGRSFDVVVPAMGAYEPSQRCCPDGATGS